MSTEKLSQVILPDISAERQIIITKKLRDNER